MWIEKAIVVLVVAVAAAWSVRFFARAWRGKSRCGCGSAGCPAAKEATDRMLRSIEAGASGRDGARGSGGDGGAPGVRHASQ
ncbi:MAG: hypothetical protein ABIK65_01995 [Candidatus Eisenbacteria bacterium]